MSKAWQFWPGIGRNFVNPTADYYDKVIEKNRQEEIRLAAHEEEMKIVGRELGEKHGLKFIGTSRQYPPGTSIPRDPRRMCLVPPKSVIKLGFEVASGVAGWRVRQQLAEGVVLSGKLSTGWSVWLDEKDLADITKIFKPPVLPPVEERNLGQSDGTLTNFGGHYRVMGNSKNAQFWVIRADGSFREPDEEVGRGYNQKYLGSEGNKRWDIVAPDELAISWNVGLLRDVYAGSSCEVLHEPVGGRTQLQIDALRRIEEEVGVKIGSFGSFFDGKSLPGHSITGVVVEEVSAIDNTPAQPASTDALAALAAKFAK